ncbi:hypothetical protein FRC05_000790 [Tulasnella sp. 425]|nr:hypothetical protein FRC05_000790 [Tulasnella sp. 425]
MLWSALARVASLLLFFQVAFAATTFTNPVKNPDGSDPFMVYDGGYYYLTTTTWTNVQITRATTVAGLKTATPKVVYTDSTSTRCCNVWAPEIHKIDGKWWLYYTAGQSANLDLQRSHVLQGGSTPWDPYSYKGQLKATNAPDAWSIDGTVLTVSGTNYFVFSSFSPNNIQSLYIAPMTNAYTLGARSLLSEPLNSWERVDTPVNEGPQALYKNGAIYLTYSASFCWTSSYSLGLLKYNGGTVTSASSWTKSGPVFTSANGHYGPGHNGFFNSPDGQTTYLVYHATSNPNGACDGTRYTLIQPLYFHTDGVSPIWGVPRALTDNIPEPASAAATTTTTATTTKTTTTTTTKTTTTTTKATTTTTTSSSSGGTVAGYGQCGGQGWTGGTVCVSGYTCVYQNDWYSQCVPN